MPVLYSTVQKSKTTPSAFIFCKEMGNRFSELLKKCAKIDGNTVNKNNKRAQF